MYVCISVVSFFIAKIQNRPEVGRFRKIVEFDQSKGIGRLARPRRSRLGYWFGRPTTTGGAIDDNRLLNFGGPIVN
jgi:hypothetical protein